MMCREECGVYHFFLIAMTAMIFGELYKNNGIWKFNAMGQPTNDTGLKQTLEWFQ